MRLIASTVVLAALAVAPAWAGVDNPDVLNVNSWFTDTSITTTGSGATIDNTYNDHEASGSAYGDDGTTFASIDWELYSPDKVNRNSSTAKMKQGSWVWVELSTWTTSDSSFDSGVVEKCKADTKVKLGDPDNEAKWKVRCNNAIADLGISAGLAERIEALIPGVINASKDKIRLKGQGLAD